MKRKCVKLFEPTCWRVNRKATNMKKSHFHPGIEAANVVWDFGNIQMHSCSLLLGPERLVYTLSHNSVITNNQFGARMRTGTHHANKCTHPHFGLCIIMRQPS